MNEIDVIAWMEREKAFRRKVTMPYKRQFYAQYKRFQNIDKVLQGHQDKLVRSIYFNGAPNL